MKDRLRILFLVDFFSFLGGTEYNNYNLLTALKQRGHEILVCVGEKPGFDTWPSMIRAQGIEFYASEHPYIDTQDISAEREFARERVAGLIEVWKPDLIFAHPPGKLLIAYLEQYLASKIPVIAMEYTVPAENTKHWYHPELPKIQQRINGFIAKCEPAERGIREVFGYQGKIYRLPNLVAGGPSEEPEITGDLTSVGCVARLSPEKGIGFLLGAWSQVIRECPTATLHLYGHGLHEAYYRSLTDFLNIGDSVFFEGTFPPITGIADVARRHRIFVQPSLFESIPNSMIELARWKKAFVATRVGGIPELLNPEKGEGILVSPGSTDELAMGLLRLLRDGKLADRMAEAAYRSAHTKYDIPTTIQAYEEAFRDTVERSQEGAT